MAVTAALATVLLAAAIARAEPLALRPGMGGVADAGAMTCALLNEAWESGPTGFRQMLLYWTEGYVYGRTRLTMDAALARASGGPWTFDTLTDRLLAFCRDNPQANVATAVDDWWQTAMPGG
jgi:hypothetical protein